MLFSSISFLYYFLPAVLLLYFIIPGCGKNVVLLLASLFFYAWGEPRYLFLMVATILLGYVAGILMENVSQTNLKKLVMVVSVLACLGILGVFKYADFFIESFNTALGQSIPALKLALPIGISFYTFQLISYLIDVYHGRTEAQKDPIRLAVYICMFPQLIAGPIVRYTDVKDKLWERELSVEMVSYGIGRFCMGLGKKVLLANSLGELCDIYKGLSQPTVLFTWIYALALTLQIYFDFSGYSDMAIGFGSMLGFEFPENFRYPLTSKSATEFWRRWHITLGSWFRDYLYIPLGGNRVSVMRHVLNIMVVWMATGLWHGASWNFVLWGLYFGGILLAEKYTGRYLSASRIEQQKQGHCCKNTAVRSSKSRFSKRNVWNLVKHIYLLIVVMVSFILFDHTVLSQGLQRICALFGGGGIGFISSQTMFYLKDYGWILLLGCLGATELPRICVTYLRSVSKWADQMVDLISPVYYAVLLLLSTAFLINGSFNPFLYFRF